MISEYFVENFFEDVLTEAMFVLLSENPDIKNGALHASDIFNDYVDPELFGYTENEARGNTINAIGKIAEQTTRTLKYRKLDYRIGMLYFAETIAKVANSNNIIDSLDYWGAVQMISALRASYILQA